MSMPASNEYDYKIALVLRVTAENENEAAEYASDFIMGLSQYVSSDDPEDDHYEIVNWTWMY